MGSLGSRPSPPPPPPPVPSPSAPSTPPPDPGPTPEEAAAQQRRESLLRRSRGRFGTVLTGFRGLLDLAGSGQRKTLLGE